MSLSQKVVANTVVQIVSKIITASLTLLTTILLTGYLGREGFGDYIYVITLVVIFGALADWGTATIGVREAAKEKEKQNQILVNLLILRLLLAFGALVLFFGFAFLIPLQTNNLLVLRQALMIASLMILINSLKSSFRVVFQVKLQMEKFAVGEIITSVFVLLLSWFLIYLGLGLFSLMAVFVLAAAIGVTVAGCLVLKTVKLKLSFDKAIIKNLLRESLPMGAILMMFTIDNKIDTVMLAGFRGSSAVGVYGVAYRVYDVLILGAAFLMNVLLPVLSKLKDRKILQDIYQKSFDILFLMGIMVGLGLWLLSPLMVQILTQKRFSEFQDAVMVLKVLSPALFLAYFNHLTGFTIVALGKQRSYFWVALGSMIFNILANSFLIPRFSYFGAATVTILTEAIVLVITTIFIARVLKFVPSITSFPKTAWQLIKEKGRIF